MLEVVSVHDAVESVRGMLQRGPRSQGRPTVVVAREALGRVLAVDVVSGGDLPPFCKSTVDGYAVYASDTFGASESLPALLTIAGEITMGSLSGERLAPGSAMRIPTGGALPQGADAVAMVEYCDEPGDGSVSVGYAVAPGENVIQRGEDVSAGSVVLHEGHRLRPQDLGALEGIGATHVEVYPEPRVAVISTGDEVVEGSAEPGPGRIRDVNGPALYGALLRDGAQPELLGIVPDQRGLLEDAIRKGLQYDAVVVSGGSSAGTRDMVASVLDSLGAPGVIVHGLALKPGKPTIVAVLDGTLAIGLPGHPASALVAYETVVRPLVRHIGGEDTRGGTLTRVPARARCSRRMASRPGREDYVRCTLRWDGGELWADPVLGKSGLISTMVRATAFIHIPLDRDGVEDGEFVDVYTFD